MGSWKISYCYRSFNVIESQYRAKCCGYYKDPIYKCNLQLCQIVSNVFQIYTDYYVIIYIPIYTRIIQFTWSRFKAHCWFGQLAVDAYPHLWCVLGSLFAQLLSLYLVGIMGLMTAHYIYLFPAGLYRVQCACTLFLTQCLLGFNHCV